MCADYGILESSSCTYSSFKCRKRKKTTATVAKIKQHSLMLMSNYN